MTPVFIYQLLYYIAATVMFALGMKYNFYYLSGQKSVREFFKSIFYWYKSYDLSTEPESRTNTFMLISNGCNLIIWVGLVLFTGLFIYYNTGIPEPYVTPYTN